MFFENVYDSWSDIQNIKYSNLLERTGDIFSGKKILDVGAGRGFLEAFLKRNDIYSLDNNLSALKNNPSLFRVLGNMESFPFKPAFDVVLCIDVIHLAGCRDLRSVLKPKGIVVIGHFYNKDNFTKVVEKVFSSLRDFKILDVFVSKGKENEFFAIAT